MNTNNRMRKRFSSRISPDIRIEALLIIKSLNGPDNQRGSTLGRYMNRYGLTNTLGSHRLLGDQWLVLTEHRVLLFAKHGGGLLPRIGPLEHALQRTDVELQWADFSEATLQKRLIHLTTTDQRMNISHTVATNDEADLFVRAVGDRAREIGLQEL